MADLAAVMAFPCERVVCVAVRFTVFVRAAMPILFKPLVQNPALRVLVSCLVALRAGNAFFFVVRTHV